MTRHPSLREEPEILKLINELISDHKDLLKEIQRHESAADINRAIAKTIEREISNLEDMILKYHS